MRGAGGNIVKYILELRTEITVGCDGCDRYIVRRFRRFEEHCRKACLKQGGNTLIRP